jgi:cyclic pyranopterin phosphate synthase
MMSRTRRHSSDCVLSHVDAAGRLHMVDVGEKPVTRRRAVAEALVRVSPKLAKAIAANTLAKGDLLAVARLAGIQAAKRTGELVPLCHSLSLQHIDVQARLRGRAVLIRTEVATSGQTGVEMEALTAAAVAALTVIDMGKSVDHGIVIEHIRLLEKTGGIHGDYRAAPRKGTNPDV